MSGNEIVLRKIKVFAVLSRLIVFCLQVSSNLLFPDHDADAFKPPVVESEISNMADLCIHYLFGGFKRWDAIYFTLIAQYGYVYDQCLAFFPLFPFIVNIIANYVLFPLKFIFSPYSLVLLSASLLNTVLFVKTAEKIFLLGQIVLKNEVIAYKAALLFCINPASVFMSAPYSETMFLYLTVSGMICLESDEVTMASIFLGLSAATRSNGLISIGYLLHKFLREFMHSLKSLVKGMRINISNIGFTLWVILTLYLLPYAIKIGVVFVPFVCYQYYGYMLFCTGSSNTEIPAHIVAYGNSIGAHIQGQGDVPAWCNNTIPLAYSYIQTHYWNQGLFNYWKLIKLPNFILAAPVTALTFSAALTYYRNNRYTCMTLGLDEQGSKKKCPPSSTLYHPSGIRLLPYIVHPVILTIFGWLCIHVEVLTRMLFSSCPPLYWHAAHLISDKTPVEKQINSYDVLKSSNKMVEDEKNFKNVLSNLLINQVQNLSKHSTWTKCVLFYFIGYFVIGTVLFSNFLPWT